VVPTSTSLPSPAPTPAFKKVTAGNWNKQLDRRYLYNTTIGEEYVNCTTTASVNATRVKRVYEFGQEIIPQCGTFGDSGDARV
jgi:hypothetical protein